MATKKKAAKKTAKKKGTAQKYERVRSYYGETFKLTSRSLGDEYRSVKLIDLRESLTQGGPVPVTFNYPEQEEKYAEPHSVSVRRDFNNGTELNIGCQIFSGKDAEKILKRLKVPLPA
jgi:hypothetical protein